MGIRLQRAKIHHTLIHANGWGIVYCVWDLPCEGMRSLGGRGGAYEETELLCPEDAAFCALLLLLLLPPPPPPPPLPLRWQSRWRTWSGREARSIAAQHSQRAMIDLLTLLLTAGPRPLRVWAQQIMYCAFGGLAAMILSGWWITANFGGIYAPVPLLLVAIWYNFIYLKPVPGDTAKYITFHDTGLEKKYGKVRPARVPGALACSASPLILLASQNKIPISVLYETYVDGDLEFKGDVLVRRKTLACIPPSCRQALVGRSP
eukprot:COSAG02_NODE_14239_length_1294_cov_2.695397_1_plen_262_part_00